MKPAEFAESYDVVVVGFGFARAIAAITAADAGAKVLLIEKSEVPGGLSICSYGAVRSARDAAGAFAYLKATNDGRSPDDVLRVLAEGMCGLETYVRELAKINGAVISTSVAEAASGGDDSEKRRVGRSEEHTSELQSPCNLVCRLLLEKKKKREHKPSTPSNKMYAERSSRPHRRST